MLVPLEIDQERIRYMSSLKRPVLGRTELGQPQDGQ